MKSLNVSNTTFIVALLITSVNSQTMFYPILAKPNQVAREIHKNAFAQFMKIEEMEEARKAELSEAHINDIERTDVNIDMNKKEENSRNDAVYVKGGRL